MRSLLVILVTTATFICGAAAADPDGARVDQACVVRQLRAQFLARLANVHQILDIPLSIHHEMRDVAGLLLQTPSMFPYQGLGCGGELPAPRTFAQATRMGRFTQ